MALDWLDFPTGVAPDSEKLLIFPLGESVGILNYHSVPTGSYFIACMAHPFPHRQYISIGRPPNTLFIQISLCYWILFSVWKFCRHKFWYIYQTFVWENDLNSIRRSHFLWQWNWLDLCAVHPTWCLFLLCHVLLWIYEDFVSFCATATHMFQGCFTGFQSSPVAVN